MSKACPTCGKTLGNAAKRCPICGEDVRPQPLSKYHAHPTVVDGIRFASLREATRYGDLKLLQKAGQIKDLVLQPHFPLVVNGVLVCTYIGDFQYVDVVAGNIPILEDTKGFRTREYQIKKKLVKALYGVTIHET